MRAVPCRRDVPFWGEDRQSGCSQPELQLGRFAHPVVERIAHEGSHEPDEQAEQGAEDDDDGVPEAGGVVGRAASMMLPPLTL